MASLGIGKECRLTEAEADEARSIRKAIRRQCAWAKEARRLAKVKAENRILARDEEALLAEAARKTYAASNFANKTHRLTKTACTIRNLAEAARLAVLNARRSLQAQAALLADAQAEAARLAKVDLHLAEDEVAHYKAANKAEAEVRRLEKAANKAEAEVRRLEKAASKAEAKVRRLEKAANNAKAKATL